MNELRQHRTIIVERLLTLIEQSSIRFFGGSVCRCHSALDKLSFRNTRGNQGMRMERYLG